MTYIKSFLFISALFVCIKSAADVTRTVNVPAGKASEISHHIYLDKDCSPNKIELAITQRPNQGKVSIVKGRGFYGLGPNGVAFDRGSSPGKCFKTPAPALILLYEPSIDFQGVDLIQVVAKYPDWPDTIWTYIINVK